MLLLVNVTFQFPKLKLGRFWQFLDLGRAKYTVKAIKNYKAGEHIKGSLNLSPLSNEYLYHVCYNKVITKETSLHFRQALLRKNSSLCELLEHLKGTYGTPHILQPQTVIMPVCAFFI